MVKKLENSKRLSNKVRSLVVKPILTDAEVSKLYGSHLPKGYFKKVIKKDIDVYTSDGKLLIRFRKNVLPKKHINDAYENMIEWAKKSTSARGAVSGKPKKGFNISRNKKIQSNILGYFDTFSISQKYRMKLAGIKKENRPLCRETSFNMKNPNEWKKVIPLIKDIDKQYKKLCPSHHKKQYNACLKTNYRIKGTSFSTVTTNLNLQTGVHTDRGDYKDGFGNLVVIEKGKYNGGFTGFPKYGIGVDVRTGDFLAMDVHEFHGNTPIEPKTKNTERLSLVCYFREGLKKCNKNVPIYGQAFFDDIEKRIKNNQSGGKKRKNNKKVTKKSENRKVNTKSTKSAKRKNLKG